MAHALQYHQREQLRAALLHAGITEEVDEDAALERPFVVSDVRVGNDYIVAFCHTAHRAHIDGLARNETIDPDAFSDSLVGSPELPADTGPCAMLGLVRVERPRVGKLTLRITLLRYVPMDEAMQHYQALLAERAPEEPASRAEAEETEGTLVTA